MGYDLHNPAGPPFYRNIHLLPPSRSRNNSQSTPDNVDLLDLTDPWGTSWHHTSPYDFGIRPRRASTPAVSTSIPQSSHSTSVLPNIHLPRKLSKRHRPQPTKHISVLGRLVRTLSHMRRSFIPHRPDPIPPPPPTANNDNDSASFVSVDAPFSIGKLTIANPDDPAPPSPAPPTLPAKDVPLSSIPFPDRPTSYLSYADTPMSGISVLANPPTPCAHSPAVDIDDHARAMEWEERDRKDREEKDRREREERDRREREERDRKDREERDRKDREERDRKDREERDRREKERKTREEKDKREREERDKREKERKDREERDRKEKERKVREERDRKERDRKVREERDNKEQERRDQEERERKEKERRIHEERERKNREEKEERERKDREEKEKKDREERERKDREEKERKDREERQRKDREESERKRREEKERNDRERAREEKEKKKREAKRKEDKKTKDEERDQRKSEERKSKDEKDRKERTSKDEHKHRTKDRHKSNERHRDDRPREKSTRRRDKERKDRPNLNKPTPPPPLPSSSNSSFSTEPQRQSSTSTRPASQLASAADLNALRAKEVWEMERLWKARSVYGTHGAASPAGGTINGSSSTVGVETRAQAPMGINLGPGTFNGLHGSSHTAFAVHKNPHADSFPHHQHRLGRGGTYLPPIAAVGMNEVCPSPATIPSLHDSLVSYEIPNNTPSTLVINGPYQYGVYHGLYGGSSPGLMGSAGGVSGLSSGIIVENGNHPPHPHPHHQDLLTFATNPLPIPPRESTYEPAQLTSEYWIKRSSELTSSV